MGTLPQGERWKHAGVVDFVHIDNVFAIPDAERDATVDGAGTPWKD